MDSKTLKVIVAVVLCYLVLIIFVINIFNSVKRSSEKVLTVKEHIQHLKKENTYSSSVLDFLGEGTKAIKLYIAAHELVHEEKVELKSLIETHTKVIETLNKAAQAGTDQLKHFNQEQTHFEPLIVAKAELKGKLTDVIEQMEGLADEILRFINEIQHATKQKTPWPSHEYLHKADRKAIETISLAKDAQKNIIDAVEQYLNMTRNQQDLERLLKNIRQRVIGAIVLCCLMTIVFIFYILRPKRHSLKLEE